MKRIILLLLLGVSYMAANGQDRAGQREMLFSAEVVDVVFGTAQSEYLIARSGVNTTGDVTFVLRELKKTEYIVPYYVVLFEGTPPEMYFFLSGLSRFSERTTGGPAAARICGVYVEKNVSQLPAWGDQIFIFEQDGKNFSHMRPRFVKRVLNAFEDYCIHNGIDY